jgi:seryl-tRNA synthetase
VAVEAISLPGLTWHESGQSSLSGDLLELDRRIDRLFLSWAAEWKAEEHRFPTFIAARELGRLDYFHSFPHLVTFPVVLDPQEENLKRFAEGEPLSDDGALRLTAVSPIRDVLTPAACYHFYAHFRGRSFAAPAYLTTRSTCFRREAYYAPLRRQWSFSMRELVCIGGAEEVESFLETTRERVAAFFTHIGLPVDWLHATDPFFNPTRSAKYIAQKLEPVKTEMVFGGDLAIGSVNFHRSYMGEAFDILRGDERAYSGCVAFGLERWLYALTSLFGPDLRGWPDLASVRSAP